MRKIIIILIIISTTFLNSITLEQAKELGLKNNLVYQNSANDEKIAKFQKYTAHIAKLPQVSINGNIYEDRVTDQKNENYTIQASKPIFQGGQVFYETKKAKNNHKISENNLKISEIELLNNIETKYYNCLNLMKKVKIAHQSLEQATQENEKAKIKLQTGNIAQTDYLQFQLNLSEKENSYLIQKNNYEIALQDLANYLNISTVEVEEINQVEVLDEISTLNDFSTQEIENKLSKLLNISSNQNLNLKNSEYSIENTKYNLRKSQFSFVPDLSLTYQKSYMKNELQSEFNESEQFGINFSYSLTSLASNTTNLVQNKYRLNSAMNNYESLDESIKLQIKNEFYTLITTAKSVLTTKISLEQGQALYEQSDIKFQVGELSAVDFLNSTISLENTQTQYSEKFYNYLKQKSKLNELLSQTNENKLNQILFN